MYDPLKSTTYFVQEMLLKTETIYSRGNIGIPKENQTIEKRLAITPETTSLLVEMGYQVIFESGAGLGINYSDNKYAENGAIIVDTPQEVYQHSDYIMKMALPTESELLMMKPRSVFFSFLNIPQLCIQSLKIMAEKRISAIAYEFIHDHTKTSPFVTAISEIEGIASITVASEMLSNASGGKGILLGGVPGISPTEIVIIGAGIAGTTAAKSAMSLGALVRVFDNDIEKLRTIQNKLGQNLFTSTLQSKVLRNAFRSADVVIGSMQYVGKNNTYRISEDLIREMKNGAIIIDLRISQGGCFETTMEVCIQNQKPIFEKHGVLHICEKSISSRVSRTASISLSNIIADLFTQIGNCGGFSPMAHIDRDFASGFYMYNGKVVNSYVGNHFNVSVNDIGLFLNEF